MIAKSGDGVDSNRWARFPCNGESQSPSRLIAMCEHMPRTWMIGRRLCLYVSVMTESAGLITDTRHIRVPTPRTGCTRLVRTANANVTQQVEINDEAGVMDPNPK